MSDLIKRLRERAPSYVDDSVLKDRAADIIESLEKRVKELDDRLLDKQNANKALFSIYDESEVENNLLKDKVKELNNDLEDRQKGFEDILRCYDMPNKVISTCKKFVG